MNIMITGATGFVGQFLVPSFLEQNHQVIVVGRTITSIQKIFQDTVTALTWEELDADLLRQQDVVINLAGFNIAAKRWTSNIKNEIIHSRVDCTKKIVDLCLKLDDQAPHIFNASAVGVYGLNENNPDQAQPLDESYEIPWGTVSDFSSEVGQAWEQTLQPAIDAKVPVTIMRFGVVLHPKFGMLKKLLPSVKLGIAGEVGSGKQMISWIHIDDLVRAIHFLIDKKLKGVFNLTSPNPVKESTFIITLCNAYKRACYCRMPAAVIKIMFGQMGEELILKGQQVVPTALLKEGFEFTHPTIKEALQKN